MNDWKPNYEFDKDKPFFTYNEIEEALKDPTNDAPGDFSEGYRACLKDLKRELGLEE